MKRFFPTLKAGLDLLRTSEKERGWYSSEQLPWATVVTNECTGEYTQVVGIAHPIITFKAKIDDRIATV